MSDNAFLTGSRVYGTPRETSDYDLVVRCDNDTYHALLRASEGRGGSRDPPIRFGRLDIIAIGPDGDLFDRWKHARDKCLAEKPVTRDRAIQIHQEEGINVTN